MLAFSISNFEQAQDEILREKFKSTHNLRYHGACQPFEICFRLKMTTLVHSFCSRHVLCVDHNRFETVGELKAYLTETKVMEIYFRGKRDK